VAPAAGVVVGEVGRCELSLLPVTDLSSSSPIHDPLSESRCRRLPFLPRTSICYEHHPTWHPTPYRHLDLCHLDASCGQMTALALPELSHPGRPCPRSRAPLSAKLQCRQRQGLRDPTPPPQRQRRFPRPCFGLQPIRLRPLTFSSAYCRASSSTPGGDVWARSPQWGLLARRPRSGSV